jgi:methionyl-tRNA formyltransferase
MDEGMDTGAVLMQDSIPIAPDDTAGTLSEKLSLLGSTLIVDALDRLQRGSLHPVPQDGRLATIAPLLKKEDGRIDWRLSAARIHDRVRGLSPWPGAFGILDGKLIKLIATAVLGGTEEPGTMALQGDGRLVVGTGGGLLQIVALQPEGKRPMSAAEFLRGHRGLAGRKFEAPISKS